MPEHKDHKAALFLFPSTMVKPARVFSSFRMWVIFEEAGKVSKSLDRNADGWRTVAVYVASVNDNRCAKQSIIRRDC